jgi:hypothetical protein
MLPRSVRSGLPGLVACFVAAGIGAAVAGAGWRTTTLFVCVALTGGVFVAWWLGRREAQEIEDVLGWAIASALVAFFLPLALFVILYIAGGHGA